MIGNIHSRALFLIVVLTSVLLLATASSAAAQRTMKGQHAVGAEVSADVPNLGDLGLCLNYSQYLLNSYWQVYASAGDNHIQTDRGPLMEYVDCFIGGDFMYRLIATRSRSVSLYAGGGAFIGYEFYDPRKDLPANINTNLPTGSFLYGISPRIEAEFFFTRRLALILGGCFPVSFSSPLVKLRPNMRMGVRVDI